MPLWKFRIGDVFDADDPLSIWILTLSIAFNDAVHSKRKLEAVESDWEFNYEWRVAISHFSEASMHLERGRQIEQVANFLESEPTVRAGFEDVLARYEAVRRLANRIRNEAAFHYPYESGQEAVARAVRELANEEGTMGGLASNKIRDSRQFYADEVVAKLIFNAAGGKEEALGEAVAAFGKAVAAFGRFANAALDAYFWPHRAALQQVAEAETA